MSIFRSPQAKQNLVAWHHRFKDRIGRPTESIEFDTRFGATHVLTCGPKEAPPLVLFHGALASSAHALAEIAAVADHFRVYAIDVIGQSPMSAEVRPEVKGNSYGEWAVECLDKLRLERANLVGVSWGGFIALRVAAVAPGRIEKLSLIVPAGMVNGHGLAPLTKQALPLLMYRAFPTPQRLERFVKYQLTTVDSDWKEYLGDAIRDFKLDFRPPRLLRDNELAALRAPVQIFGAELDLMFPGQKLLDRAKKIFPNLESAELLLGSRHSPATDEQSRAWLTKKIAEFFGAGQRV